MKVRRNWMRLALATGAVGAAGYALSSLLVQTGSAHLYPGEEDDPLSAVHTGRYTYDGASCGGEAGEVDPVNVIFYGAGALVPRVVADAEALGFTHHSGSTQYFWDHGECDEMDDQSADGSGISTRDHMRFDTGDVAGALNWDPSYKYYVTTDAHHEDRIPPFGACGLTGGHAVDSNDNEWPGGFNMARNYVAGLWQDAGHAVDWQYWGNQDVFRQCDGEYAWSDGLVAFVEMRSSSSGGCRGYVAWGCW